MWPAPEHYEAVHSFAPDLGESSDIGNISLVTRADNRRPVFRDSQYAIAGLVSLGDSM